jgi:hypothetical protein
MENQNEMVVAANGLGLTKGAYIVFDLIEQGVQGEALQERANA